MSKYSPSKVEMNLKDFLIEDLESKKSYEARMDFSCGSCGDLIFYGDEFYFEGSKRKICNNCLAAQIDLIKNI